jgi:hypothetical protein
VTTAGSTFIESLLGVPSSTNGSTLLSNPFVATAGQALSFQFNYISTDGSATYPDYGFVRLLGGDAPIVLFTAQTTPTGNTVPGFALPLIAPGVTLVPSSTPIISTGFSPGGAGPSFAPLGDDSGQCFDAGCGYTNWIFASYVFAAPGTYQLQFGVFNVEDEFFDSALAFDFAIGASGAPEVIPSTTIPEPSSIVLLATGLAGVIGAARRKRGTQAAD